MRPLSRRSFLAAGAVTLVAACGDDSTSSPTSVSATPAPGGGTIAAGFGVAQRFPSTALFVPGPVRLPVSLIAGGTLATDGPAMLQGWIEDQNGKQIATVSAPRRSDGVANPYWEVRVDLPDALVYSLRFPDDDGFGAMFELWAPSQVRSPLIGNPLPPFDTPTVDDHRGVEPYCTLTPTPCPLHEMTLTAALQQGTPVAYLVGTPAHCQTGTCAPGLEMLVAEHQRLGGRITMVHADVYADQAATDVAPAVASLNVDYEPIIYFTDATGVIVDRLDGVWDRVELRERLDLLLA